MSDRNCAFAFNQVALGASAAIAAWLVTDILKERQNAMNDSACAGCDGTGYVDCFCTKWNFSSASSNLERARCGSCHGSLKEKCPKCNGSGRLVERKLQPSTLENRVNHNRPYGFVKDWHPTKTYHPHGLVKAPRVHKYPFFRTSKTIRVHHHK
mmetsp:Transcript_2578/g.7733  ORF Transcript_2578/g.7733 Transcript_2578/m.7733 type:complete len:154 (+) Transcript_2578:246-707(+)